MYLRERETRDVEDGDLESPTSSFAICSTSYSKGDLLEGSPVGSRDSKLENESEMIADDCKAKGNRSRAGLMIGTLGILSLVCVLFVASIRSGVIGAPAPLTMEVVYPQETGYNIDPPLYATLGADMINRDDIAFCESAFVYGVTSRIPSRGCVAVAHQDLWSDVIESKIVPYGHYCIGSSLDELHVDFNMIKAAKIFEDPETGYHTISQFSPGKDVVVVIFSGKNFDGQSVTVSNAQDGRLTSKFYPDGSSANDNVQSFIIKSSADHYFAGKDCGLNTQICPVIIKKEDAIAKQPEGCALFTTRDMTDENLNHEALTKGVRVCVNSEAEEIKVGRDALEAMKMIYDDGDRKSKISYINEGADVALKYYDSSNPVSGEYNLSAGSQIRNVLPDGKLANDNIYSFKMSAPSTTSVPSNC